MRTHNGHQPWEVSYAPRDMAHGIRRYVRALYQTPKTSGNLRERRRQLRTFARRIGPEAEERLELLFELLHAGQRELWRDGQPDPGTPLPRVRVAWDPAKRARAVELLPALANYVIEGEPAVQADLVPA